MRTRLRAAVVVAALAVCVAAGAVPAAAAPTGSPAASAADSTAASAAGSTAASAAGSSAASAAGSPAGAGRDGAGPGTAALGPVARGTTIRATEAVNLRTGPSTAYPVIVTVPGGHTATVVAETPSGGFHQVDYQGRVGWTSGDWWTVTAGLVVNGHRLTAAEETAVRWLASNTVARVAGTRAQKLDTVGHVAWWSLKEGVLGLGSAVHPYSNCAYSGGQQHVGPLVVCPAGRAWQVGIAAAQVPNYPLASLEATATRLYPGNTVAQVLAHTANYAGYPTGTSTHTAIVGSTGSLRASWLLRNHGVGATHNAPTIRSECVTGSMYWCYGTGWTTTARYAPSKTAALRAIGELKAIMNGLS